MVSASTGEEDPGEGSDEVSVVDGWPSPQVFTKEYIGRSKPLLMKNAAKVYPAFWKWTDDYFLNEVHVPKTSKVMLERFKKEARQLSPSFMNFKEWVKTYNNTDKYMVQDLPRFLG